MTFARIRASRWLLASVAVVSACSQASPSAPTSARSSAASGTEGRVGASALGDVKVGSAPLEIDSIRLDRQTPTGASIFRQYAEPDKTYRMEFNEVIELWVEHDRGDGDVPKGASPENPRLIVDWGDGGEPDATGCGSCRLTHRYSRRGVFTVRVSLDDRAGTRVTRTFALDSTEVATCGAPASTTKLTGDDDEDEDNSFNDAVSGLLGPVDGANTLTFACTEDEDDLRRLGDRPIKTLDFDGCYGHAHSGAVNLFVEVHNPDDNSWTRVFTKGLFSSDDESADTDPVEFTFHNLTITFARQRVDRIRLLSDPGQNQTYHAWNGTTMTVSCQP